jgi:pimeloyl-ACP methyl ester carboxylesterase
MPALFVHGVPETHHLWDPVRSALSRKDTIAVALPGFGVDAPGGFGFTKEEYADWLIAEVEKVGEPVDIVGHDWGALLTERLVSVRPDLVRTWAAGGGAIDEGYTWHQVAQIWQTPGQGEQFMQMMAPDAVATSLSGEGVPEEAAKAIGSHIDDRMKAAILPLYRSAVNYGKDWGPDLDRVQRPGLLIWGESDPYMQVSFARRLAERTGAELIVLNDCGHWWPVQRPQETAQALERFWSSA